LHNSSVKTIKLPGSIDLERLLGGIDLSATLQTGRLHMQNGLLQQAHQGAVCISMAERFPSALVAPITQAMDTQSIPSLNVNSDAAPISTRFGVIALDESLEDDAPIGKSLPERLGIWLDLKDLAPSDIQAMTVDALDSISLKPSMRNLAKSICNRCKRCCRRYSGRTIKPLATRAAVVKALGGVDCGHRYSSLALRAACCHAALNWRSIVEDEDLEFAARRVLAPQSALDGRKNIKNRVWRQKRLQKRRNRTAPRAPQRRRTSHRLNQKKILKTGLRGSAT
jgi:magnesium chelatase subunit D